MATQTKPKTTTSRPGTRTVRAAQSVRPTEEQIRQRAYEIFIANGAQPGNELAHWLQAEQELAR